MIIYGVLFIMGLLGINLYNLIILLMTQHSETLKILSGVAFSVLVITSTLSCIWCMTSASKFEKIVRRFEEDPFYDIKLVEPVHLTYNKPKPGC